MVPKPSDWGPHIDITGYLFLNESKLKAEGYTPPKDLAAFLAAGPPPVYIGALSFRVKQIFAAAGGRSSSKCAWVLSLVCAADVS